MIEKYVFGEITINSKKYRKDVVILGDAVLSPWIRSEGHMFTLADAGEIVDFKPECLVVGTGCFGMMKVDKNLVEFFNAAGCTVHALDSKSAAAKFNETSVLYKTAAAIHLTC